MGDLHCTCTRLRKAARRITRVYDQHLAGTGFAANQRGIVAELARTGDISMSALAARLGMDPSTREICARSCGRHLSRS